MSGSCLSKKIKNLYDKKVLKFYEKSVKHVLTLIHVEDISFILKGKLIYYY